MESGSIDAVLNLDALPDDVFRYVWEQLLTTCEQSALPLRAAFNLFHTCHRLRAAAWVVERLNLGMLHAPGWLQMPDVRFRCRALRPAVCPLLAPYGWAAAFPMLRELHLRGLSWEGAARLITLLPAWRNLEELDLRFQYGLDDLLAKESLYRPFQLFAEDLALALGMGYLPRLKFLFIGNACRSHCLGQLIRGGASRTLDDTIILEALPPTAALWWMAERAEHVRASKLHQWSYELEHGADVHATFGGRTLLEWMHERLAYQHHSLAGHRRVHALLLDAKGPK